MLLDIFAPQDITYFRLPIYCHFSGGPYHVRTVRQEWDKKLLREVLAANLIRSDVCINPEGQPDQREETERLLFRLGDDVFCDLDHSELTVYALTWARAAEFAEQLAKKYAKAKPDQPCFYLLSANHGDIHAERIKLTRSPRRVA